MSESQTVNKKYSGILLPFTASISNGFIFAPLELGSTRSKSREINIRGFRSIIQVYKNEGFFSLWRGSGWFILGNTISRTNWLLSYDFVKKSMLKYNDSDKLSNSQLMSAGFIAGGFVALTTNPIWTLKSFSQLPNYQGIFFPPKTSVSKFLSNPIDNYYSPLVSQNRSIILQPRTLMAGTFPAVGYVATESMCQLFILEKLRDRSKNHMDQLSSPFYKGLIGGLLGGISRVVILPLTFPLHVITLRFREQYKPLIQNTDGYISVIKNNSKQSVSQIVRNIHNDRAWYAGIGPYSARVIPQSALLFFMIETFRSILVK